MEEHQEPHSQPVDTPAVLIINDVHQTLTVTMGDKNDE